MTRFAAKSTNLAANDPRETVSVRYSGVMWILLVAALIAYSIPWVHNSGTILQPNAFDLAEWASLHPTVQNGSPAFIETLLLRLQLVIIAAIIAYHRNDKRWSNLWILRTLMILLIAIAMLPPLEYFTAERSNPNYGQQFALFIAILVIGTLGLSNRFADYHKHLITGLIFAGLTTSIIGIYQTTTLMQAYLPNVQLGFGGLCLIIVYMSILIAHASTTYRR